MSTIKEVAVRKAIAILASVDAQFKIIDSDGNEYGELQAVKQKVQRKSYIALYRAQLEALPVGGIATIEAPVGSSAESLRSAAQAFAIGKWGTGSTISARKDSKIEILRVF